MLAMLLAIITAVPAPAPSASAEPLRVIITVKSSPFCSQFATHVNSAIGSAVRNDETLGHTILTLQSGDLATNELTRHNEIQRLAKLGDSMYREYRAGLAEVNTLRDLANSVKDEQEKAEIKASADALGGVLYRQHLIQRDLDGFVAYLDMYDMRAETNEQVLNHQIFGSDVDIPFSAAGRTPSFTYPVNFGLQAHLDDINAVHPPEQDVHYAYNASQDFQHRIPDIFRDEMTAGAHITQANERC